MPEATTADDLLDALRSIRNLLRKQFFKEASGLHLSSIQARSLLVIIENPGLRLKEYADRVDHPSIADGRLINRLIIAGFVSMEVDKSDRRNKRYFPTVVGLQVRKNMEAATQLAMEKALAGLDASEIDKTINVLEKVKRNLERIS